MRFLEPKELGLIVLLLAIMVFAGIQIEGERLAKIRAESQETRKDSWRLNMELPVRQCEVKFGETPGGMLEMWVNDSYVETIEVMVGVAGVYPAGALNRHFLQVDARYDIDAVKKAIEELVARE